MFSILLAITSPFVGLSIHGAISVKYFHQDETNLPIYIGNCFILLIISSAFVSLIFLLFGKLISSVIAFPLDWLWAVLLVSVGQFVILVLMTLWRVQEEPFNYFIMQVFQTLMNISLTIFFVVVMSKNWQGRIEAQLFTVLLFSIIAFYWLYKKGWLKFNYNREYIGNALRFGVPLIPHTVGAMLITQTDRVFITNMIGIADTGIYTAGFQVAAMVGLLATSFNYAYAPWLYKRLKEDNFTVKTKIVTFTYIYFVAILLFALLLSLVAAIFLDYFVGERFVGAYRYTFWLALGFSFNGMYFMVANYIFYVSKTHLLAWITFIAGLLNIVFNYVLIKMNGAIGAAQASALAFFISFILTWILSSRVYSMPWSLKILRKVGP